MKVELELNENEFTALYFAVIDAKNYHENNWIDLEEVSDMDDLDPNAIQCRMHCKQYKIFKNIYKQLLDYTDN